MSGVLIGGNRGPQHVGRAQNLKGGNISYPMGMDPALAKPNVDPAPVNTGEFRPVGGSNTFGPVMPNHWVSAESASRMSREWNSRRLPIRDPETGRMTRGDGLVVGPSNISASLNLLQQISRNTREELELTRRVWSPTSGMAGSSVNIPTPPGGWSNANATPAVPAFLHPMGGGVGGGGPTVVNPGGGGGGGVRGGGGGGRGGRGWGSGGAAFGGSVGGIAGSLIARSPVGRVIEAAVAVGLIPQEISGLIAGVGAVSKEGGDFIQRSSNLAGAGGIVGRDLRAAFGVSTGTDGTGWENWRTNTFNQPEWMTKLGLTPQRALELTEKFGIAPTGTDQAQGIAEGLGGFKYSTAFRALPSGMAEQAAGTAAKYGIITADRAGIAEFTRQMEPVLVRAGEMSLNRASIMQSINSYVAATASSGGTPTSLSSMGKFVSYFTGAPGGRTGEMAVSTAQTLSGFGNRIGQSPFETIAATQFASQFHSQTDIKNWMTKTDPGSYERLMADPGAAHILDTIGKSLSANGGKMNQFSAKLLYEAIKDEPILSPAATLDNPMIRNINPDPAVNLIGQEGSTGLSGRQIGTYRAGRTSAAAMESMRPRGVELLNRFQKDLGLTQTGAAALVGNLMQESGLDPNVSNKTSGATGYAQWLDTKGSPRKSRFIEFRKTHPNLTPDEANVQFLEQEIQGSGYSDVLAMLRDPTASLKQSTLSVRRGYEGLRDDDTQSNDTARIGYASGVLNSIKQAGPRTTPAENATAEPELVEANRVQSVVGASSLAVSLLGLNEAYKAAAIAARMLATAMDNIEKMNEKFGNNSGQLPAQGRP
jgi:Phage tail lysozyme